MKRQKLAIGLALLTASYLTQFTVAVATRKVEPTRFTIRIENISNPEGMTASNNLYVSAPGGLWVISPEGEHLGTIITPRHVHNMAWGDADRKTLYLCARSGLYRIRLNIAGAASSPRLKNSL